MNAPTRTEMATVTRERQLLNSVRKCLRDAEEIAFNWDDEHVDRAERLQVQSLIERAFVQTALILEERGLTDALRELRSFQASAKRDYAERQYGDCDYFLIWPERLRHFITPFESSIARQSVLTRVTALLQRFHSIAVHLKKPSRKGRRPMLLNDEYDVQHLLGAILKSRFADVRPEEWNPSYAGKSTRVDFLLKQESIVVEAKMTRKGLADKSIGRQLIEDIAHYRHSPGCKGLVCLVYDPTNRLRNPVGLCNDLSEPVNGFEVEVLVQPRVAGSR